VSNYLIGSLSPEVKAAEERRKHEEKSEFDVSSPSTPGNSNIWLA